MENENLQKEEVEKIASAIKVLEESGMIDAKSGEKGGEQLKFVFDGGTF